MLSIQLFQRIIARNNASSKQNLLFYLFHLIHFFFKGDIGQWLPNGTMKIIDRRQTILKLAQVSYL